MNIDIKNKNMVKKALMNQALKVVFKKKNGEKREMLCTRDFENINAHAADFSFTAPAGKGCELPKNLLRVWSLDDADWRIINLDTLISVKQDS